MPTMVPACLRAARPAVVTVGAALGSVLSLALAATVCAGPASAAPAAAAAKPALTPEQFGAVGNGVADDTAALQAAFDAGSAQQPVALTPGRVYAHSGVLHLRRAQQRVDGAATLLATRETTSSVWIEADGVSLSGATLATAKTSGRWDAWEQMGLRLFPVRGVTVSNVTVTGSAAAGIYVGGAIGFTLDHDTVRDTRADGIHITGGAAHGQVVSPVVQNSGDDGVAVVSYEQDGAPCRDITVSSPTVLGTTWGRGLSVVGGNRVTMTDIDVQNTSAAGVYVAAEGNPWNTTAPRLVVISGGSISGANTAPSVDHGAVLVLAGRTGIAPAGVTVKDLAISGTRSTASRDLGVITYGTAPTGVVFSDITVTSGPANGYQGNTPASSYRLTNVMVNGRMLPAAG